MSVQQNFRSAFNGFNREDVVHYIEYLNSKHAAEVSQLKSEVELLREQCRQDAEKNDIALRESLEAELAALKAGNEARLQETAELEAMLSEAMAEKEALMAQLEEAKQQQTACESRMEEELAAYRRAEEAERMARERAQQMYRRANGIIADATVKVDEAAAQIGQLSESVMAQLQQLQVAVSGSNSALKDAAASMFAIRPETEE